MHQAVKEATADGKALLRACSMAYLAYLAPVAEAATADQGSRDKAAVVAFLLVCCFTAALLLVSTPLERSIQTRSPSALQA